MFQRPALAEVGRGHGEVRRRSATPLKLLPRSAWRCCSRRSRRGRAFYRAAFYLPSLHRRQRRRGARLAGDVLRRRASSTVRSRSSASTSAAGSATRTASLYALVVLTRLAVRRADGHLPGRAQADPAELYEAAAVDGAGPLAAVLAHHAADALPGASSSTWCWRPSTRSRSSPRVRRQRRHGRPGRRDAVLHALPVPAGLRASSRWATPPRWPGCS